MHLYHITCRLPNASEDINGVEFEMVTQGEGPDDVNHVQSIDAVDADTARQFHGIPGYEIEPQGDAPALDAPKPPVAPRAQTERPAVAGGKKRGRKSNAERAARAAGQPGPTVVPPPTTELAPPPEPPIPPIAPPE